MGLADHEVSFSGGVVDRHCLPEREENSVGLHGVATTGVAQWCVGNELSRLSAERERHLTELDGSSDPPDSDESVVNFLSLVIYRYTLD
jgi:hypothetical protein